MVVGIVAGRGVFVLFGIVGGKWCEFRVWVYFGVIRCSL